MNNETEPKNVVIRRRPAIALVNRTNGQLTASVRRELETYVFKRAERLGWTRNKFCTQLYEWWIEQGAPPIHEMDKTLTPIPKA